MAGLDDALAPVSAWLLNNLMIDVVRVVRPVSGDPVLNPDTGDLEYPEPELVYEGVGGVVAAGAPGGISSLPSSTLPWAEETMSPARLFTPLSAPMPARDDLVTVITVHNPANTALIGRTWFCQDPGRASTVEVVRVTPLDMKQAPRGGAS
ncbi:PCQ3_45 (plasmid) [Streptomyces ambofaciens ATCC 23877]|uniref:PCQ3_45 n=1 Tax=Streptomyces ambofaciens (strain ATCC 23877 / 3486 / DSM 40053 / JCM 4204 / NBRC 12836 / NRRL B-2516) TaxID=278992 RepID=A0A0K2B6D8_STRA7|nr:DUF6093 family protein [Streptomyces ambofaciens]AKZ60834.1 PCQ3_45 [Streptomyces ambofaciens ATCC 23877]